MLFSFLEALILDCALILIALTAHELGHVFVANIFRVPVKEVGISWTGPYVRRARATGWREVAVCLAGAVVNLLLAAVLWRIDHWFALFNLTVGVVNLLPITHSDGSHALEALRAIDAPVTARDEEEQNKAA